MVLNCKWPKPDYSSKVRHQHIKILAHLHKKKAQERCLKSEKVAPTQARCGSSGRLLICCLSEVITEYLSGAMLPECRSAEVVLAVQLVGLLVVVGVGGDVPDISQYRNTEYGEQKRHTSWAWCRTSGCGGSRCRRAAAWRSPPCTSAACCHGRTRHPAAVKHQVSIRMTTHTAAEVQPRSEARRRTWKVAT